MCIRHAGCSTQPLLSTIRRRLSVMLYHIYIYINLLRSAFSSQQLEVDVGKGEGQGASTRWSRHLPRYRKFTYGQSKGSVKQIHLLPHIIDLNGHSQVCLRPSLPFSRLVLQLASVRPPYRVIFPLGTWSPHVQEGLFALKVHAQASASPWHLQRVLTSYGTGESYGHAKTICILTDDALLDVFDFYRQNHDYSLRSVWE